MANRVNKPKVSIVGAGNVGSALAFCIGHHNYSVELISRDREQAINRFSKALVATGLKHPPSLAIRDYPASFEQMNLVLLCVPDCAIETTCESLAKKLCGKQIVAHCSGAIESSVLDSAK
jgi:glycerol-3-phosphate dehydrogenase